MNLYAETIDKLKEKGKTNLDVLWIGCKDFKIDNFWDIAKHTKYDNGFGGQEIAPDLVIVGKDFIMSRKEYDGSEGWIFNITEEPKETKSIKFLSIPSAEAYYDNDDEVYFEKTLAGINKINN